MHINDSVLDEKGMIDPHKIDLVARMGGDYYCRASGDSVFVVPKPNLQLGIGIDKLPLGIRQSKILTGNELGVLGNSTSIPVVSDNVQDTRLKEIFNTYQDGSDELVDALHKYAQELIKRNQIDSAWQVLLSN
jgi:hypothetical protein